MKPTHSASSASQNTKQRKPVYIAHCGAVTIQVHRYGVNRSGSIRYSIDWRQFAGAPVTRERFSGSTGREKAIARADEIAKAIANSQADVLTLSTADRDAYRYVLQRLSPTGVTLVAAVEDYVAVRHAIPAGHSLHSVCSEWLQAKELLGPGVSVLEVVRDWLKRHVGQHYEYFQHPEPPKPILEATSNGAGLPRASGIYFVWSEGKIVYVGLSRNLAVRCRIGMKHSAILAGDWLSWLEEATPRLKMAEAFYIGTLKPKRNFPAKPQSAVPTNAA